MKMAVRRVFILDIFKMAAVWARANRIIWWEMESGKVEFVEQNLVLRQVLKLSWIISELRFDSKIMMREKREFRLGELG